jgi:hypothetical protein
MSDSRADSLAAELKRRNVFDDYFAFWLQERPTFTDRQAWLKTKGIEASFGSLHRLHRSPEASQWRMAEAARARKAMDATLPEDIAALTRKSLLDQRFNATLGELSHKELMDHLQAEHAEEMARLKQRQLDQKDKDLSISERRVSLLEENAAKAKAALEGIKSKGGLTPETLKQIEEAAGLL